MGMFDYIRCLMPLPPEPTPPTVDVFQTKDTPTDQLWLDMWEIRVDGSLVRLGYRIEDRSDKSAPKGSIARIAGCMTKVYDSALDKIVPHHGDINFYEYDHKSRDWWEYRARFTDGTCTGIVLVEFTPGKNAEATP